MAPESERAMKITVNDHVTLRKVGESVAGDPIYTSDPLPNEPTLTCSEVVERLRLRAYHRSVIDDPCDVMPGNVGYEPSRFDSAEAEKILHSWRERRVQELENLIAKQSGCSRCTDSASGSMRSKWRRKIVLLAILAAVLIVNAGIVELDRLYRTTMHEVEAPTVGAARGYVWVGKDCPARGDGKTDDAVAIQACIDSTSPAPMAFYFPAKTYFLTSPITLRDDRHDIAIIGSPTTFTSSKEFTLNVGDRGKHD